MSIYIYTSSLGSLLFFLLVFHVMIA